MGIAVSFILSAAVNSFFLFFGNAYTKQGKYSKAKDSANKHTENKL